MSEIELTGAQEQEFSKQWEALNFGVSEITPTEEFRKMLRHSIKTNKPLRVKCGIDPTSSDVHLGHTVPYRKMRQFQDFGHIGVVIIGDYTASIGDPSGKNESRPPLDDDTVKKNAQKYMEQIYTVLNPDKTEVCFQSEWFSEVGLKDLLLGTTRYMSSPPNMETPEGLEYQKADALMGMASNRLGAANQARAAATQSIMSGVGSLAAGAAQMFPGGDAEEGNK